MAVVTAAQILKKLESLHTDKPVLRPGRPGSPTPLPDAFYSEVKTGRSLPGYLRFDAVAIKQSWKRPLIIGYEIKVSRNDFLRDKKWRNYQKYCHEFWFACPVVGNDGNHVIKLDELPGDVGLIYYSPEHDTLFTKRRAMYRKIDLRSAEVVGMLYYLTMYRCGSESRLTSARGDRDGKAGCRYRNCLFRCRL